ncbi:MAG TPA: S8 family peptidase, partial [Casimicrobiaceae bacterium]
MGLGAELLTAGGIEGSAAAEALASKLASSPDVEFAEVDHLRYATQAYPVDDAYVGSQTYLADGPSNINAFDAWTVTHGSPDIVVAVIDTGYRPHIDLAGRILPGYDMISDPAMANDGNGRDSDASDPGDWVTSADLPSLPANCKVATSSWHGTSVAGIIAADTDNNLYVAGIDWNAKILPVRVLGRCGGYDSDIVDGILWAAGLSVPGVPDNPHPAQVLNLSLGGEGPCEAMYSLAILAAYANGVTRSIVVAAGNSSEDVANATPADCPGVIRVASTTTKGSLAPYSNYGPSIMLSAPGGSPYSTLFNYSVPVLSNSGTHGPVADSIGFEGGTSFSAPMVSGTISMMLAVNPELSPEQIVSILASTASPYASLSNCTTAICGAGIVNVGGAVRTASAVQTNYQGLWWASPAGSESGWGLNVAHQGNIIFATWFTYDTSGKALWLSMTGVQGA